MYDVYPMSDKTNKPETIKFTQIGEKIVNIITLDKLRFKIAEINKKHLHMKQSGKLKLIDKESSNKSNDSDEYTDIEDDY